MGLRPRFIIIILIASLSLLACHDRSGSDSCNPLLSSLTSKISTFNSQLSTLSSPLPRTSVTFIMGTDREAYNKYYSLAANYYRINAQDRTDQVVEGLTSLSQMLDWLQAHPPQDSLPYGLISIVTHGNQFIDLQMKVTPHGQRSSAATIHDALESGKLHIPDSSVVDNSTLIFLHGCAVGHNQALLDELAVAFGQRATVVASKLFEYYAYLSPNKNPQSICHYYARIWYAFYHPDSTYDEQSMLRQLQHSYPSQNGKKERTEHYQKEHDVPHKFIEPNFNFQLSTFNSLWREGLQRRFQENPSQIYHYSFTVPCVYEESFSQASEMPSVGSREKKQRWIAGNKDFQNLLALTHIPKEYFQTKFYRNTTLGPNNEPIYNLVVKSRAGVICLIQPLIDTTDSLQALAPLIPPLSDTAFFAKSSPDKHNIILRTTLY